MSSEESAKHTDVSGTVLPILHASVFLVFPERLISSVPSHPVVDFADPFGRLDPAQRAGAALLGWHD